MPTTTSAQSTVALWDFRTNTPLVILDRHRGPVRDVAFNSRGDRIVTASDDKTARVWDSSRNSATFGAQLAIDAGHIDRVVHAEFSPDGRQIVTASADRTAIIWDTWPLSGTDTAQCALISSFSLYNDVEVPRQTNELSARQGNSERRGEAEAEEAEAKNYEFGIGVGSDPKQALLHLVLATQLYEKGGNIDAARRVREYRGALARSLDDPQSCADIARSAAMATPSDFTTAAQARAD
jgi:hypothetical protein